MTTADDLARYLPYWRCRVCGVRVFKATINVKDEVCHCDRGEGSWAIVNGHLLEWAEKVIQ